MVNAAVAAPQLYLRSSRSFRWSATNKGKYGEATAQEIAGSVRIHQGTQALASRRVVSLRYSPSQWRAVVIRSVRASQTSLRVEQRAATAERRLRCKDVAQLKRSFSMKRKLQGPKTGARTSRARRPGEHTTRSVKLAKLDRSSGGQEKLLSLIGAHAAMMPSHLNHLLNVQGGHRLPHGVKAGPITTANGRVRLAA
jgi:hypothetical protein